MKEFIEHQPTDRPLTTEEEKLFEKFCSLHNTFAPRTCNVDGETIYEVAKGPFGDYQQVSETAYKKYEEEYLTSQRKEFLAQRLEAEKAKDHAKKLANVGGLHFHREYYSNLPYEKRLLEVMQQKQIPHMKEIPAYMEKQKEEITRFQGLAKREKKTDFYEQSILNFLEKYEKEWFENTYLYSPTFEEIEALFMQGYIDDPTLFYRFQNIQHQNLLQSIKRLYTYDDFERGNAPEQASRAPILSGDSANRILYLMRNYKITVEDLWETQESFQQRMEEAYKRRVVFGDYWLYGLVGHSKHNFISYVLHHDLWRTDEHIQHLQEEGKLLYQIERNQRQETEMKRWEQDIEESIQHASSGFAEANWDLGTEETFAVLDKIEKEIIQKAKKLIDDPQIFQRFCKKRINPLFDIYTRRTTRKSLALGLLQGALYPKDRARDDFQTIEENVEATLRSSLEPQIQSDELSQQYTTYLSARKIFFRQKGKSLLRERFKDLHNPEITSEQLYNDMRKFLGFIRQETIYWLHDPHGEKAPQPQWYLEYHPEVEQQLYPELQIPYKKFFQKVEKIRPQILQRLLQEWGSKNMEGRVKRMVEDQLLQQFWVITMSEEQIDFMLEFLTTNLEQIFLEDFNAGMFTYFLESDKELLKIYIKDILTHFFQINTLQKRSNNLNFGINPEKEREENENP